MPWRPNEMWCEEREPGQQQRWPLEETPIDELTVTQKGYALAKGHAKGKNSKPPKPVLFHYPGLLLWT